MTTEQMKARFKAAADSLVRDHVGPDGEPPIMCHTLHHDFGLGHSTPDPWAISDLPDGVSGDEIDFSPEHHELHVLLETLLVTGMNAGWQPPQLMAAAVSIGRRIGLMEAAEAMNAGEAA